MSTQAQAQYSQVCRIQFLRCVPATVKASSVVHLEIICCSEFNDPINIADGTDDDHSPLAISVSTRRHSNAKSYTEFEEALLVPKQTAFVKHTGATSTQIIAPSLAGHYSIYIEVHLSDRLLALPVQSEKFTVCNWEECKQKYQGRSVPKLLCCYRPIDCLGRKLFIREEYGLTLGSHIYDSSIILLRYLELNLDTLRSSLLKDFVGNEGAKCDVSILELGAGCGLVGIWLSSVLGSCIANSHIIDGLTAQSKVSVYLTDKKQQLPLLQHNIDVNAGATTGPGSVQLSCAALDWADNAQLRAFKTDCGTPTLIIAGDVFYDREVAGLFFDTVRKLGEPGKTKVLVAQKLRVGRDNVAVALISESEIRNTRGFECISMVHCEADVILWSMQCC